jgi:hypothetical protein
MSVVEKAAALLEAVSPADLQAMPPAARRRFAAACRQAADLAEPKPDAPRAGVLCDLRRGDRAQ